MVREAILDGDYRPGQPLVETDIAAQLGVSRAPVREAMRILSAEGLVETVPYHGTTVRALNRDDIDEIYSLRALLETFAIKRVIQHNDPADLARLRELYDVMLAAARAGDLRRINAADREFHLTLIERSRHGMLLSTYVTVGMRVRQVMALINRTNEDLADIAYNHLPILDAIAAREPDQAVTVLEQHIASIGKLIVAHWQDAGDGADGQGES